LWVETDGTLGLNLLSSTCRERLESGFTTIGINVRTVNEVAQEVLQHATVKTYRDRGNDGCILDETAVEEKLN
jgi:hypothetical protein